MNLLPHLSLRALVEPLGWTLLHFLWQGAAIALVLCVTLRQLRHAGANARYLAATTALALMALCPVLTLGVLTSRSGTVAAPLATESVTAARSSEASVLSFSRSVAGIEVAKAEPGPVAPQPAASHQQGLATALHALLPVLVTVWLLGVALLSARLLGGWLRVQKLIRQAAWPVESYLPARCAELARRMGIARTVAVRASASVQVPAVAGWLRATVLFPVSALSGLPQPQLEALLAHELAHIRRNDYLVNLAQTAMETLLFYHPAVWWVSRRIRVEREHGCDDLVVQVLGDRLGYARALTALEEMRGVPMTPALAATGGDLLNRVRRILGLPCEQTDSASFTLAGVASLLLCLALGAGLCLQMAQAGQTAVGRTPAPDRTASQAHLAQGNATYAEAFPLHVRQREETTERALQDSESDRTASDIEIDPEHRSSSAQGQQPEERLAARIRATIPDLKHRLRHLASLQRVHTNLDKLDRELAAVQARIDSISRRMEREGLTLDQRIEMGSQLGELGSEIGNLEAQHGLAQANRAVDMANDQVRRTLKQTDAIVRQTLKDVRVSDIANDQVRRALKQVNTTVQQVLKGLNLPDLKDLPDVPDVPDVDDTTDD